MAESRHQAALRLAAWLDEHPPSAWPIATNVVATLHDFTDATCAPESANRVFGALYGNARRLRAGSTTWATEKTDLGRLVAKPNRWVFCLFGPNVRVPCHDMAVFLRCLDVVLGSENGAVLTGCIRDVEATTPVTARTRRR